MAASAPVRHRTLRTSSFGARLTAEVWQDVIGAGMYVRVPPGCALVREGDPPGRAFVIVEGWARVVTTSPEGRESLLALRGPGDLVGELAALRRADRAACVRSMTAVEAVRFSAEQLVGVMQRQPAVGEAMMSDLAERLVDAGRQLIAREVERTEERLAGLLRRLLAEAGRSSFGSPAVVLELPLSQEDLGDLIGASRESVARALCRLRAAGVITTNRRSIVVLDAAALS
jgi:CRP-like cAMP-binding protein